MSRLMKPHAHASVVALNGWRAHHVAHGSALRQAQREGDDGARVGRKGRARELLQQRRRERAESAPQKGEAEAHCRGQPAIPRHHP
jgi:hypothetical protein